MNRNADSFDKMVEVTHVLLYLLYIPLCLGLAFLLSVTVPPFGLNSAIFPEPVIVVDCTAVNEFENYFTPIRKETISFVEASINTRTVSPEVYGLVSDLTSDVLYVTTTYQGIGDMGRDANALMNKAKFILYITDVQQSANEPVWVDVDRDYGDLLNNVELFTQDSNNCR